MCIFLFHVYSGFRNISDLLGHLYKRRHGSHGFYWDWNKKGSFRPSRPSFLDKYFPEQFKMGRYDKEPDDPAKSRKEQERESNF